MLARVSNDFIHAIQPDDLLACPCFAGARAPSLTVVACLAAWIVFHGGRRFGGLALTALCVTQAIDALSVHMLNSPNTPAGVPLLLRLRAALGRTGIDKRRVSRICKELDEVVEPFRNRPPEGQCPFVWLDAVWPMVRHNHRMPSSCRTVVSQAPVIATGA